MAEGHPSCWSASQGEALLQKLAQLLDKNISLAVATSSPSLTKNSTDLRVLVARGRCLSVLGPGPGVSMSPDQLAPWDKEGGRSCLGEAGKGHRCPLVHQEGGVLGGMPEVSFTGAGAGSKEPGCHSPWGRPSGGLGAPRSPAALTCGWARAGSSAGEQPL